MYSTGMFDNCDMKGLDDTKLIGMFVSISIPNFTYLEAMVHCLYFIEKYMLIINVNFAQVPYCYILQTCEKVKGDVSLYKSCTFV
jgi:hypothetical protein